MSRRTPPPALKGRRVLRTPRTHLLLFSCVYRPCVGATKWTTDYDQRTDANTAELDRKTRQKARVQRYFLTERCYSAKPSGDPILQASQVRVITKRNYGAQLLSRSGLSAVRSHGETPQRKTRNRSGKPVGGELSRRKTPQRETAEQIWYVGGIHTEAQRQHQTASF